MEREGKEQSERLGFPAVSSSFWPLSPEHYISRSQGSSGSENNGEETGKHSFSLSMRVADAELQIIRVITWTGKLQRKTFHWNNLTLTTAYSFTLLTNIKLWKHKVNLDEIKKSMADKSHDTTWENENKFLRLQNLNLCHLNWLSHKKHGSLPSFVSSHAGSITLHHSQEQNKSKMAKRTIGLF